jgi:phosphoglycerol transferase MdoB-like AlkP superfamily enzyme
MNNAPLPCKGWNIFSHQLARDTKLWLWVILLLFISRVLLVWVNRFSMEDSTTFADYAVAFIIGFRFDLPVATIVTIPSFLCSCLTLIMPAQKIALRVRNSIAYIITILWVIITPVTLAYFKQYHNQFDAHMLGIVHDDFGAIITTVLKSYPIIKGSLVMICIAAFLIFISRRWIRAPFPLSTPKAPRNLISRIGIGALILITLLLGLRGSLGHRPIQKKDAGRTQDTVLNRCVINPFSSLKYAIAAHQDLMNADGLDRYLKKESPLAAFRDYAGNPDIKTVDEAFLRTAKGHPGKKPRHIFLIIMESYDGWTMLERHADWNISNELKQLGQEGIYVRRFLPGSRSTMTSLATIVGGMADAGVITNERSHPSEPPYGTAIAAQMKELGYQTHFWYAGYSSWQRIGDFSKEQGFDKTHMASSMGKDKDVNEWGVSDKHLFAHIKSTFNTTTPTFNVILTSSNHPPYSLDLEKENCPITSVPTTYQAEFAHGTASVKMLGHHWYSDKWMGDFVRGISSNTPDCLFAITADHWGRIFPGPRPSAFERAIVPLVLYGPDILPKDIDGDKLGGSHYDLGATLIELAAEPGFPYHAIGKNILTSKSTDVAMSRLWLLGDTFIMSASDKNELETLDGQKLKTPPIDIKPTRRKYKLTHGISWWRLRKGNKMPDQ